MDQRFNPRPHAVIEYTADGPILILGLPGVPGFNAFYYIRTLFPGSTFGVAPPNAPELSVPGSPYGPGILAADPEDPRQLAALFDTYRFKTVIDASGWCALKSCEFDPALARRLNVDIGRHVMEACRERGVRLIRLSTDLVFSHWGDAEETPGGYSEDSPVSPVTVYGKMMAEAENIIGDGYPEAAILRIALPMGPSLNGHAGAVDWIESRFRKGKPATLYFDEVRSNLYVQDLNRVLAHFCGNGARGIWHVGGPRPLSLFRIAQAINKLGNYPPDLLMGCPRAAAGPMPPRAGNVSMDTAKVTAMLPPGILRPWPARPEHVPTDGEWHRRRDGEFPPGSIAENLYGDGWPGAWDHPLLLVPGAGG